MQALGVRVMPVDIDAYALSQRLMLEAGDLSYVGVRRRPGRPPLDRKAVGEDRPPDL